jgi:hypothetical protein
MAITALDQTFVDPVVIGFGKICLGRNMASVAQLGLVLDKQMLRFFGVMRGVAVKTSDVTTGVRGLGKMGLLMTFTVAA